MTSAEPPHLARKPNYDFEKRRKELERKRKKDEKLRRKREDAEKPDEALGVRSPEDQPGAAAPPE